MSAPVLKPGSFYWVIPVYDVDLDDVKSDWMNRLQPARYGGRNRWSMLGQIAPRVTHLRMWRSRLPQAPVEKLGKADGVRLGDIFTHDRTGERFVCRAITLVDANRTPLTRLEIVPEAEWTT